MCNIIIPYFVREESKVEDEYIISRAQQESDKPKFWTQICLTLNHYVITKEEI